MKRQHRDACTSDEEWRIFVFSHNSMVLKMKFSCTLLYLFLFLPNGGQRVQPCRAAAHNYLRSLWIPMLRNRQQCSSQYSCGLGLVSQCGLLVNNGRPSAWTAAPALGVYPLMLPCPQGAVATKQCCYHVPQNRGKRRHWELLPSGLRPSGSIGNYWLRLTTW